MLWVLTLCALGGICLGLLCPHVLALIGGSLQICFTLCGLWAAGELSGAEALSWSILGVSAHQFAFLGAALFRSAVLGTPESDGELSRMSDAEMLDEIAERMRAAPEFKRDAGAVSRVAERLRRDIA